MRIDWAAEVLTEAKLTVVEEDGWTTRGKEFKSDLVGVLAHHDASAKGASDPSLIIHGDATLAGPRAQFYLARDGVWHVLASGRANHAGKGYYNGVPSGMGNYHLLGVEAANNGVGEPWPEAQMESYITGVGALLMKLGAPSLMAFGHKEYAPTRKIDPSFDMDYFRARVRWWMCEVVPVFPGFPPRKGAANRGVVTRWVRRQLAAAGCEITAGDEFDGDTEKAVKKLQKQRGLKETGIVDPITWHVLAWSRPWQPVPPLSITV